MSACIDQANGTGTLGPSGASLQAAARGRDLAVASSVHIREAMSTTRSTAGRESSRSTRSACIARWRNTGALTTHKTTRALEYALAAILEQRNKVTYHVATSTTVVVVVDQALAVSAAGSQTRSTSH